MLVLMLTTQNDCHDESANTNQGKVKGISMRMKRIGLFLVLLMLIACTVNTDSLAGQQETPPAIETQIAAPMNLKSTPIVSATIKASATHTILPTPILESKRQCIDATTPETMFPSANFNGSLVLISSTQNSQKSYLLDLASNQRTLLPNNGLTNILNAVISPNGSWIAYSVFDLSQGNELLLIVNSTGNVIKEHNFVDLFQSASTVVLGWLDDERLVGVQVGEHPEISPADNMPIILNPFTGKWSKLKSDYKDIYSLYPQYLSLWGENFRTLSVFHPTLKWVVYKSFDGVVLWDLVRKQTVKMFPDEAPITSGPVWSPDGERFVIDLDSSTGRNIFLVSTTGELEEVTFFEGLEPGDLVDFTWSPDGNSIAFWLSTRKGGYALPVYDLAILRLNTRDVQMLCIQPYGFRQRYPRYPVWSPDGKYVAVAAVNIDEPERSSVVLIDLINNRQYKIADDVIPAGWMVGP